MTDSSSKKLIHLLLFAPVFKSELHHLLNFADVTVTELKSAEYMCNAATHWVGSYPKMCTIIVQTSGLGFHSSFIMWNIHSSVALSTHTEIVK